MPIPPMNSRVFFPIVIFASSFALGFLGVAEYKKVHFGAIVVDTHNDVVQRMMAGEDISVRTNHGQSDLPRFREGGIDLQVFSIWVPPEKTYKSYYEQADDQIDSIRSFVRRNRETVGLASTSADIAKLIAQHKFVAMMGIEGGHPIENSMKKLEHFYRRGVRYLTLTWNNSTQWATSASDETDSAKQLEHKGLTGYGKQIVRRMNKLHMMIDVSHVGEQTFWDVMKTTERPVIASHSSAWTLCHHRRNLKDNQLRAIQKNGGVVFINFAPQFIDSTFDAKESAMRRQNKARIDSFTAAFRWNDEFLRGQAVAEFLKDQYRAIRPPLEKLIDHFDYVARLIGVDHVGIGSDFDGIAVTPMNMDDVTYFPNITRELLKRGYSEDDVRKILGGNFLRVFAEVEKK